MKPEIKIQSISRSLSIHLVLAILITTLLKPSRLEHSQELSVELIHAPISSSHDILKVKSNHSVSKLFAHLDLRPSFITNGTFFSMPEKDSLSNGRIVENEYAHQLLFTETKVLVAFDRLAEKINQQLDYPDILAENGVHGTATLDLYFDHNGAVDESKSKFSGDNRSVRGLLVHASREGLVNWYLADTFRLKKDQFKDMHFHADFSLSYFQQDLSALEKNGVGAYTLVRKKFVNECVSPLGIDLACAAIRGYGAVHNLVSSKYTLRFHDLQAQLDQYDELGLSGIDELIRQQG